MTFPVLRAKAIVWILRLLHRDQAARELEAALQRDADEVGRRADRQREARAARPDDPRDGD